MLLNRIPNKQKIKIDWCGWKTAHIPLFLPPSSRVCVFVFDPLIESNTTQTDDREAGCAELAQGKRSKEMRVQWREVLVRIWCERYAEVWAQ